MFWERFVQECSNVGKKPNPVAKELGISSGAVTSWKNGRVPNTKALNLLSEYFGVSVDYLLGRTDKPDIVYKTSSGTAPPTPTVEALQRVYASLNARGKERVLDYASDLAKSPDYTTAPAHPYRIAARGGGVIDLTEEEYKRRQKELENAVVATPESHPWL